MSIKPVDFREFETRIFGAFQLSGFDRRYIYEGGRLLSAIRAGGGQIIAEGMRSGFRDRSDFGVLDEGTDSAFWTNPSFLMYCYATHVPGTFYDRALLVEGCPSAEEFVRYFHAHVRPVIFDVDALILGPTTQQLLIVTHYGVVALVQATPHA